MQGKSNKVLLALMAVVVLAAAAMAGWVVVRSVNLARTSDKDTMAQMQHQMDGHPGMNMDMHDGMKMDDPADGSTADKDKSGDKDKDVIYTCPMHPEVEMHEPGKCPVCGMDLVPKEKEKEK